MADMIAAWKSGDRVALDRLVELIYPELQQIAHRSLQRRQPGDTLETAALANEAYLKLTRAGKIVCESREHFLAICAQMMRRILVDHRRQRAFAKRGGDAARVPLDEALLSAQARGIDVLDLDEALNALAAIDGRKCRIVELRFFCGLTIEETAELLGVSVDTAKRDWRMARAWLASELAEKRDSRPSGGLGQPDGSQRGHSTR